MPDNCQQARPFYEDHPRDNSNTIAKGIEGIVIGGVLGGIGTAAIVKKGGNASLGYYYLACVGGAGVVGYTIVLLVGLHREKMHPTSRYSLISDRHSMGVALNF